MNVIAGSIIAANQEELDKKIDKLKNHVSVLHLDVMDGRFVPNHSLDFDISLPELSIELEAHLMVKDPEAWIHKHGDKVDTILIHIESIDNPTKLLQLVKEKGKRVGLVLNPESPLNCISPYIDELDQVLFMTVHPGRYGAPFVAEPLQKVHALRCIKHEMTIEVDGGVNGDTIEEISEAGANRFVVGSYLQDADDMGKTVKGLEKQVEDFQ